MDTKTYSAADLNPRSRPVKDLEMTLRRAIKLVEIFDEAPEDDPTYIEPKQWRKVYGDAWYSVPEVIHMEELFKRYRSGDLFHQIISLWEMLPTGSRKESTRAVTAIRKRLDN